MLGLFVGLFLANSSAALVHPKMTSGAAAIPIALINSLRLISDFIKGPFLLFGAPKRILSRWGEPLFLAHYPTQEIQLRVSYEPRTAMVQGEHILHPKAQNTSSLATLLSHASAACTPNFLFDKEQKLVYRAQINEPPAG